MERIIRMGTGIGKENIVLDGVSILPDGDMFSFFVADASVASAKAICTEKGWTYCGSTHNANRFWAKSPRYECVSVQRGNPHVDGEQVIRITS